MHRQDKLVDQNLAGQISDDQYHARTGANVALSAGQAALTLGTGGAGAPAATAFGAVARGAAGGVLGQAISDVGEIAGTQTKSLENISARDYLVAASLGAVAGGLSHRAQAARAGSRETTAVQVTEANNTAAGTTARPVQSAPNLRETARFLREKGVTDAGVRRQIVEAGFEGSIGSDTPMSLARFDKLFARPLRTGRSYTGRLGNIETRVATLDTALGMERSGLQPRFEYRAGRRFVDVVGIDPKTGQPVRAVQMIKTIGQAGMLNPREIPAKFDLQDALGIPVQLRISGSSR